nr:NADH dehydrogenase subunit 2 [Potamogale velox]
MNPLITLMLTFTLLSGTTITLISSNWLFAWVGLELNMFAIIPIMTMKHNPRSIEAATKYFMIQATASMIFMMATLMNSITSGNWNLTSMNNYYTSMLMMTAILMKLGLAPFHFWIPEVIQGTHMWAGLIILTWQKIAPLAILYQISNSIDHSIILMSATLSIWLGGWGGLNQTQLRKILAYSSIAHMGWMVAASCYYPPIMILYLIFYILSTTPTFMLFMNNSTLSTSTLTLMWNKSPMQMIILMMLLLSIGGLPPYTGFLPKWLVINELIMNNNFIIPVIMITSALLNLFFYTRLIYSSSLTMFPSTNNLFMMQKIYNPMPNSLLPTLTILSTMTLPLLPMLLTYQ